MKQYPNIVRVPVTIIVPLQLQLHLLNVHYYMVLGMWGLKLQCLQILGGIFMTAGAGVV